MPIDPLTKVFRKAKKEEPFLRALLRDPARAVADASIALPALQIKRLEGLLLKGLTVDVRAAIRLSRTSCDPDGSKDPWPRLWPGQVGAAKKRVG